MILTVSNASNARHVFSWRPLSKLHRGLRACRLTSANGLACSAACSVTPAMPSSRGATRRSSASGREVEEGNAMRVQLDPS